MRVSATDTAVLRQVNKTLTLERLREAGPLSRAELARQLNITRSTMSLIMQELLEEGLVREVGTGSPHTGRKSVLYAYHPGAGFVIGVDIGGTMIKCHISDLAGNSLARDCWETFDEKTSAGFLARLVEEMRSMVKRSGAKLAELRAIGVATPGVVDVKGGVVLGASPNLPEWNGLHLGPLLEEHMGVPVRVENDVNVALMGESAHGAGQGRRHLAYLTIGTGIGGAIMMNGEIYRGAAFGAGEVGYWLTSPADLNRDWRPHGAFESLCSARAIAAAGSRALGAPVSAKEVFEAARQGHRGAQRVVEKTARRIALVVTNLANLLDLEMVILGGGVMLSGDLLLPIVRDLVNRHALRPPEVEASALRDEAGAIGAVQMALSAVLPATRIEVGGVQP